MLTVPYGLGLLQEPIVSTPPRDLSGSFVQKNIAFFRLDCNQVQFQFQREIVKYIYEMQMITTTLADPAKCPISPAEILSLISGISSLPQSHELESLIFTDRNLLDKLHKPPFSL